MTQLEAPSCKQGAPSFERSLLEEWDGGILTRSPSYLYVFFHSLIRASTSSA